MPEILVDVSVGEGAHPPLDPERVERAVRAVLEAEQIEAAEISVALMSDAEMASLNEEYLGHEGTTDSIAFALHEEGEDPIGDLYVGVEQAARQAAEFGATPAEEVLRLAVHGTLHVLGWEHPEGENRVDSAMFRRQEELLGAFLAAEGGA